MSPNAELLDGDRPWVSEVYGDDAASPNQEFEEAMIEPAPQWIVVNTGDPEARRWRRARSGSAWQIATPYFTMARIQHRHVTRRSCRCKSPGRTTYARSSIKQSLHYHTTVVMDLPVHSKGTPGLDIAACSVFPPGEISHLFSNTAPIG